MNHQRNNNPSPGTIPDTSPGSGGPSGFTLLEVMIAVAILAIALTSLLGSQSHSLSLAIEARFNSISSFLVQEKLAELDAGVLEFANDEGDFGEDFPGYTWQLEVEQAQFDNVEQLSLLQEPLYKVDLTVTWGEGGLTTMATYYSRSRQ